MKKNTFKTISLVMLITFMLVACEKSTESNVSDETKANGTVADATTDTSTDEISEDTSTTESSETKNETETESTTKSEDETTTEKPTETTTQKPTETTTQKPTETTTQKPTETTTQKPTETTTKKPAETTTKKPAEKPTKEQETTATTYEEFPHPLYEATYEDGWFTFYHDGSHPGYLKGVKSMGEMLPDIGESMADQYPGGTRYSFDEYAAIVTKMGKYKNVSLYYENSDFMNVVKIEIPLVITEPEPETYDPSPYTLNTIYDEDSIIYFYYSQEESDEIIEEIQSQIKMIAEERASKLASENVGMIASCSSFQDCMGMYEEGIVMYFGYTITLGEDE